MGSPSCSLGIVGRSEAMGGTSFLIPVRDLIPRDAVLVPTAGWMLQGWV